MFKKLILLYTLFLFADKQTVSGQTVRTAEPVGQIHLKNYTLIFKTWMNTHGFNFTAGEYLQRFQNFISNDKFIDKTNSLKLSYAVGHNQFSHMTYDEFSKSMMCHGIKDESYLREGFISDVHKYSEKDVMELPSKVDWRDKNAVTNVKSQSNCGSCWSFSTTGALEGVHSIKTGNLVSFSEQQLVDCDNVDSACNGGLMTNAFNWIKKNGGLCTEESYPYVSGDTGKAGKCQTTCTTVPNSAVTGYVEVKANDKNALMTAVVKQPISVAIQADQIAFQLYKSGVFTAKCGSSLNHGVLLVGYDVSASEPYWIVKNSWNSDWGLDGYILLAMDVSQASGQCGILSMVSYPNL